MDILANITKSKISWYKLGNSTPRRSKSRNVYLVHKKNKGRLFQKQQAAIWSALMKILNCHIRYCQDLGSLGTPVCPTSKWNANHIRGMCSRGEYWPFTTFLGMFLVRYLPHLKCFLQKLSTFRLTSVQKPRCLEDLQAALMLGIFLKESRRRGGEYGPRTCSSATTDGGALDGFLQNCPLLGRCPQPAA